MKTNTPKLRGLHLTVLAALLLLGATIHAESQHADTGTLRFVETGR
jgi:hypothetical protein